MGCGGSTPEDRAAGFSIAGWGGYHGRYNGAYVPTGERRDGRPIFKHTGPGMEWCRAYWAHGFWKIGHFHWPHHQPELCCAGAQSDARHPKDISQGTPWYEHKGTRAGHDFSSDPADFKEATGSPYIVDTGGGGGDVTPGIASSLPAGDVDLKFVVKCQGQQVGLRVGRQHPPCHDPYRCNGGGVQGEYGRSNSIQICSPAEAMTLVYSRTAPHVSMLLDRADRTRCINIAWWKLNAGTTCVMYDAYPTGPATGMRFTINEDGTISAAEKRSLVLGLASRRDHGSEDVVQLVKQGSHLALKLDLAQHVDAVPTTADNGRALLAGEWEGDYHEFGKERVRIECVGSTLRATKITGDHAVAAGMVTWEVTHASGTEGRAHCGDGRTRWWCDGDLILRAPDHIAFRWSIWKTVEYKRISGGAGGPAGDILLPVTTGDILLVTGTPVAGGAAASSSAAASMPPLSEACELFKRELGVSGTNLVDVVDATCELLGITDVKGDSLLQKAEKCWTSIKG